MKCYRNGFVAAVVRVLLLISFRLKVAQGQYKYSGDFIDEMLHEYNYESNVRPLFYERIPLNISTRFTVIAADDLNVNSMDFQMEVKLVLGWFDHRLKHNNDTMEEFLLSGDMVHKLWIPDIYIVNAKHVRSHNGPEKNEIVRLYKNGRIEFSIRVGIKASCHVNLRMFPWDTQKCPLIIQSYSSDSKEIVLHWVDDGEDGATYVQSFKKRPMAQYDLNAFSLRSDLLSNFKDSSDKNLWSSLEATFSFQRLNGFYLIQILAPTNFLVILSWVSFLIHPNHAPARVFLGTSCVLTMAAIQGHINRSLPKVSYMKIIDVYCISCYFIVVMVMAEYALVLLLNDRVNKEKIFQEEKKIPTVKNKPIQEVNPFCKFWPSLRLCIHGNPFCMHISKHAGRSVDKGSMVLFPIGYIIFNIAFWTHVSTSIGQVTHQSNFFL